MTKTPAKPFSTYPEDREKLLELARLIEKPNTDVETTLEAAYKLADLVKAILEDEALSEED